MDTVLYFIRDEIAGIHYVMYAFVCLFLMFSIIGYLFKQKYAKVELKLTTKNNQEQNIKQSIPVSNQQNKVVLGQIPSTNIEGLNKNQSVTDVNQSIVNTNQQTNVSNNQIPEIK